MPFNINQYQVTIGFFYDRNLIINKKSFFILRKVIVWESIVIIIIIIIIIIFIISVISEMCFFFIFVVSAHQKNRKIRFRLVLLTFLTYGHIFPSSSFAMNFKKIQVLGLTLRHIKKFVTVT